MIRSIRTFLLFNLFLSVTLVSVLAVIGNLFLEHKGFQTHLDSQLTLAAHTIRAFITKDLKPNHLKQVQSRMNEITDFMGSLHFEYDDEIDDLNLLLKSIQFQVWDNEGKLLLHSFAAPHVPVAKMSTGFHNIWHHHNPWRIFTLNVPKQNIHIIVLQRYDFRAELERQITEDSIMIMLITYPFLALLIWIIVGRGLASIRSTANAIKRRAPNKLTLIRNDNVPTELLPLIDELNHLFHRLAEAFDREQRFASDAAHELRTPLAALKTQVQVAMQQDETPTCTQNALTKVLKSVERSTHVVQQLLTLSRIVPEASINEPEPLTLRELASEMIIELLPAADLKNITLSLHASETCTSVYGNKTAILILLRNLIDNAIRYTPKNSQVEIRITANKETVDLRVIDNGPGISEDLRQRVFERFFRVLGTKTEGSGLGLGIVKQIVDLHRGQVALLKPKNHTGLEVKITFWKNFTQHMKTDPAA